MKDFLSALFIALAIVGLHFVAYLISLVGWLSIIVIAAFFGTMLLGVLAELGVLKIDLSNLRK